MTAKSVTDTMSDMKTETSVDTLTNASTLDDRDTGQHTKIVVDALSYTVFDGDSEKTKKHIGRCDYRGTNLLFFKIVGKTLGDLKAKKTVRKPA